jgi:hypothetical protein
MPSVRHPDKRKISAWVTAAEREEILRKVRSLGFANLSEFFRSLAQSEISAADEMQSGKKTDLDAA